MEGCQIEYVHSCRAHAVALEFVFCCWRYHNPVLLVLIVLMTNSFVDA